MNAVRLQKTVMARELPKAWREEGRFAPNQRVTIVIEPEDPELATAASLEAIMAQFGAAPARAMTGFSSWRSPEGPTSC